MEWKVGWSGVEGRMEGRMEWSRRWGGVEGGVGGWSVEEGGVGIVPLYRDRQ